MQITWLGHGTFEFQLPYGEVIVQLGALLGDTAETKVWRLEPGKSVKW